MAKRTRDVDGRKTSLADLGYVSVGLDDGWQHCRGGVNGSFHDAEGNPLIDTRKFPSMKNMTDHGHSLGLKVGWYMNNCMCNENSPQKWNWWNTSLENKTKHMKKSVQAVVDNGF